MRPPSSCRLEVLSAPTRSAPIDIATCALRIDDKRLANDWREQFSFHFSSFSLASPSPWEMKRPRLRNLRRTGVGERRTVWKPEQAGPCLHPLAWNIEGERLHKLQRATRRFFAFYERLIPCLPSLPSRFLSPNHWQSSFAAFLRSSFLSFLFLPPSLPPPQRPSPPLRRSKCGFKTDGWKKKSCSNVAKRLKSRVGRPRHVTSNRPW